MAENYILQKIYGFRSHLQVLWHFVCSFLTLALFLSTQTWISVDFGWITMEMILENLKAEISFLISLTSSSVTPSFSAFRCSWNKLLSRIVSKRNLVVALASLFSSWSWFTWVTYLLTRFLMMVWYFRSLSLAWVTLRCKKRQLFLKLSWCRSKRLFLKLTIFLKQTMFQMISWQKFKAKAYPRLDPSPIVW